MMSVTRNWPRRWVCLPAPCACRYIGCGQYRRLLREEIAETVSTPGEIDDEIRFLMSALSSKEMPHE